jgi:ferric-dicitrate binding protein FerR (iron transport regulator)
MTKLNRHSEFGNDRALEQLLRQAPPRPAPPESDVESVRSAVHAEWRSMSGKRRVRRLLTTFAIAATVLLAVGVTINALRVPSAVPVTVATIDKSIGSIYLLGKQSQLQNTNGLSVLTAGQTILTGHDSSVGLVWSAGGSLRIDEDTRVEFVAKDAIVLRSGRVYFDSQPSELSAGITVDSAASFEIRTEQGVVSHLGTQFMTSVDASSLSVSVREGRVMIEGATYSETAEEGERIKFSGRGRPEIFNISRHGGAWGWAEAVAPSVDVDKRSVHEFLTWVSRETGLQLRYEDATAESAAHIITLTGMVRIPPRDALDFWLPTVGVDWRIEGGMIVVSDR